MLICKRVSQFKVCPGERDRKPNSHRKNAQHIVCRWKVLAINSQIMGYYLFELQLFSIDFTYNVNTQRFLWAKKLVFITYVSSTINRIVTLQEMTATIQESRPSADRDDWSIWMLIIYHNLWYVLFLIPSFS